MGSYNKPRTWVGLAWLASYSFLHFPWAGGVRVCYHDWLYAQDQTWALLCSRQFTGGAISQYSTKLCTLSKLTEVDKQTTTTTKEQNQWELSEFTFSFTGFFDFYPSRRSSIFSFLNSPLHLKKDTSLCLDEPVKEGNGKKNSKRRELVMGLKTCRQTIRGNRVMQAVREETLKKNA